jgi:hypothetical protein
MAEKNEPWLPLEIRLKGDENGVERDALVSRFQEQAQTIKRKMDAGVTPREFAELDTLHKAFENAKQVVTVVWLRHHRASTV